MIVAGAVSFSQILAATGVARGLTEFVIGLPVPPIITMVALQLVVMFMGMFISVVAVIMICIPLSMPIVHALGFDPVWFLAIFLVNIEMAMLTPPFGGNLFIMKAVAPSDTKIWDIYLAATPFVICGLIAMLLMFIFPQIVLWLPGLMQ